MNVRLCLTVQSYCRWVHLIWHFHRITISVITIVLVTCRELFLDEAIPGEQFCYGPNSVQGHLHGWGFH